MTCTSCQKLIDTQRTGFVACPRCGTINIVSSDPSTAGSTTVATGTVPLVNPVPPSHKKRRLLVVGIVTALLLIIPVGLLGVQQVKASALVKQAASLTNNGQYADAATKLTAAEKLWILPSRKQQIKQNAAHNNDWATDASQFKAAQQLVDKTKYDEAIKLLQGIKNDYPKYKDVTALIKDAQTKKTAAKAAADATASAAAQAAAAKAAADATASAAAQAAAAAAKTTTKQSTTSSTTTTTTPNTTPTGNTQPDIPPGFVFP